MRPSILRVFLLTAMLAVGTSASFASSAFAEQPWWQMMAASSPTNLPPGGEGEIVLTLSNVGDASVNGTLEAVRVLDKLPAGLTAIGIQGAAGYPGMLATNGHGGSLTRGAVECKLASLSCTFEGTLPEYEVLRIEVAVKIDPSAVSGGQNEVTVSGGGAPEASERQPITVSSSPTEFGLEQAALSIFDDNGAPDTQAGSHPFEGTGTLAFNTDAMSEPPGMAKDVQFEFPAGLVGNPTPIPQCTNIEFAAEPGGSQSTNLCPRETAIGVAVATIIEPAFFSFPVTIGVPVFNLTPATGEPARFGFDVLGVRVALNAGVSIEGGYRVTLGSSDISQDAKLIAFQTTLWGVPADPRHDRARGWECIDDGLIREYLDGALPPCPAPTEKDQVPFVTLPTSCTGPLGVTVQADSWSDPGSYAPISAFTPEGLSGCNQLRFEPSIAVTPDGTAASTPTGLTVHIHLPQQAALNTAGLAESTVKDTTVALPQGVALNPAAADGLQACTDIAEPGRPEGEIALHSNEPPMCPEASKVATVKIKTPLLPDPLEGSAYLATPNSNPFGSLVALYIVAEDPTAGVLLKIPGEVVPDEATGQLVSTFKNTPQLPFEDLELHFFGGDRAPLATPDLCGNYTTAASIAPWSGSPSATPSSTFAITSGPDGRACQNPVPFEPSLTAGSINVQAGAFSQFTMTMSREDGSQDLKAVQLRLPPGLLGMLSGVKLCEEPQAEAGTCGPESLIGHTTVSVGLGGDPYSVTGGQVFVTGPYNGAPYGLSIVNPAKAGPFDLGTVVVRAAINVDPNTAALTITTDQVGPATIPHIIRGIPLEIKHVNVTIDRSSFTFNPTSCSKMQISGSLASTQGATSDLYVPFQVTNCGALAFKPKLDVTTSGRTSRKDGASLDAKLTYPKAVQGSQANIAKVKVDLPKQLPSRLTTLQKACPAATFDANAAACPPGSLVGIARASTPVLPVGLTGPAYFVSHGGEAFPSLIVVLQGDGVRVDLVGTTFISKAGTTSSTFGQAPDVPISSFELYLPEGPHSALAANSDLCKAYTTVTVPKRIKQRIDGRLVYVTVSVRERRSGLAMPTAFVGQNGSVVHQTTAIAITGCPGTANHARKATNRRSNEEGK